MVGVRKLKHFSAIVMLLGLVIIALSYRTFFGENSPRSERAAQLERRREELSEGLQASPDILGHKVAPSADTAVDQSSGQVAKSGDDDKKPVDVVNKPDETKPADVKPADVKPADVKPAAAVQHMDIKPADTNNNQAAPGKQAEQDWVKKAHKAASADVSSEWEKMKDSMRQKADEEKAEREAGAPALHNSKLARTAPPMDMKALHRSFSLTAIASGNLYTASDPSVVHVVVFCQRDDFTATLTLVNSVVTNTKFPNVTFHFVTPKGDRTSFKIEMDKVSSLEKLAFEVVEYPSEWSHGKNLMEFAPFRMPEMLPFVGGRVAVLDPYCLVTGDIKELVNTPLAPGHWAAMPSLCNSDPAATVPDERYRHYLNMTHPLIAKLHVQPDTCVPSTAVIVADMSSLRLAVVRPKLWHWVHLIDETPVFLKPEGGDISNTPAYTVVFHNHTTLLKPQWYTRLNEKSPAPDGSAKLYHWVGNGKPWEQGTPAASLWNKYLVQSTTK
ncbi:glycosyltransferase 8 domain-containing protein 1-like [Littorina saxatilis]|uniref:Uncharacterized protein n=1 Tax=Littorina saxatilis TaxID=31220 RepID=A0AAN9G3V9_9CAEN